MRSCVPRRRLAFACYLGGATAGKAVGWKWPSGLRPPHSGRPVIDRAAAALDTGTPPISETAAPLRETKGTSHTRGLSTNHEPRPRNSALPGCASDALAARGLSSQLSARNQRWLDSSSPGSNHPSPCSKLSCCAAAHVCGEAAMPAARLCRSAPQQRMSSDMLRRGDAGSARFVTSVPGLRQTAEDHSPLTAYDRALGRSHPFAPAHDLSKLGRR